ncbi:MAG: hypothetical protein Q9195_008062 [Heterodermia aff. obscurata]
MASPLAIDQRLDLNDKKKKFLKPVARYIDPKNEIHVFRKIQHWTLEIDGNCYELSPDTKKKLHVIKKATEMVKPHSINATQWWEIRESKQIEPEKRKVGQTRKTHDEILAEGYRLADGAELALATKIASGTKAVGLGTAGAMGATSGTAAGTTGTAAAGTSGTMAAGSTGSAAAGTTGTMAAGSTGTVAAGSTGTMAAGSTGTMAAGSTTAGGTAAAGSTGTAAAGGTTASTAAGHLGVGAKAAALMHGGHAAAIGSGAAKAGAVVALAHPVTGLALTGGLAYLAIRGKRGKGWNKRHKKTDEIDVFDLLEGEEEAFEQAENPDPELKEELAAEMNDPDLNIDGNLAEELKLRLDTTDTQAIQEEHEATAVVKDTSRVQSNV